jgi:hypothetical protein
MKRHDHVLLAFFFSLLLSLPSAAIGINNSTGYYCSLFLAPSTIPGAGLGVFVGNITHELGDIVSSGDIVIPIFDFKAHNEKNISFLWNEYVWAGDQFSEMHQSESKTVSAVSVGIGSTSNSGVGISNVMDHEANNIGMSNAGVT